MPDIRDIWKVNKPGGEVDAIVENGHIYFPVNELECKEVRVQLIFDSGSTAEHAIKPLFGNAELKLPEQDCEITVNEFNGTGRKIGISSYTFCASQPGKAFSFFVNNDGKMTKR